MKRYAIGVDFGTLSARAVLVDVANGQEIASESKDYTHGVMDEALPNGTALGTDWALQHPQDYMDALCTCVPEIMHKTGLKKEQVIGIGIDFTACTMLPIDKNNQPLCFHHEYSNRPHSYVKLWKHHAAQYAADRINAVGKEMNESFLPRYGGKISSEWLFPKIIQVLEEDEALYDAAYRFIEAGDWVVRMMTKTHVRSSCMAGYKAMWHKREGYPSREFFEKLHPKLANVVEQKLEQTIRPVGYKVGELVETMAEKLGLSVGTPVSVAGLDAHVCLPAAGIVQPGVMLMIMGTSTCHMVQSEKEINVKGISGTVEDGMIPGLFGYEAGQACGGDHFAWITDRLMNQEAIKEAKRLGLDRHEYLQRQAAALKPGQSGLLALDWWNGNRSVLVDADLTGLLIGCTLQTDVAQMYRSLVEATAYGTKMIIENFRAHGVNVDQLVATGGIAEKSKFTIQIYADVLNMPVKIAKVKNASAKGAAIFGAVAASKNGGGYDDVAQAVAHMGDMQREELTPVLAHVPVYRQLYDEYRMLHDYFGCGGNDVMKRLKKIRRQNNA